MMGSDGAMFGVAAMWFVWLGMTLLVLLSFLRGMRALVQIAEQLGRIEQILAARQAGAAQHASRDVAGDLHPR